VTSFANAGGGDILYGVESGIGPNRGTPVSIPGIANFEADKEELRLQNLAAAWVAPRLIGLRGRLVPLSSGAGVFVLRVRAGPRPPHMVKYGGADRFYSRHSNGRYRLDVDEIRRMALETEGAQVRLRDFRIDRIDRIVRRETGITMTAGLNVSVVLHIQTLTEWDQFDFREVEKVASQNRDLWPMGTFSSYSPPWINYEGCVSQSSDANGAAVSYLQFFRDGTIEAWCARYVNEQHALLPASYERDIRIKFEGYLSALRALNVPGPYLVGLSLINVKGLGLNPHHNLKFQQNVLVIPARLIDEGEPIDNVLRPIFDRAWHACGTTNSLSYDANGNWVVR
jgi:hypothetical protein